MGARKGVPEQNDTGTKNLKQKRFLEVYRNCANIRMSCDEIGITRRQFYRWRDEDPDFKEQLQVLGEDATESLEKIAWERAQSTSDTLLIFLLKALRPEKYREIRDVRLEHSGSLEVLQVVKRVGNDLENV